MNFWIYNFFLVLFLSLNLTVSACSQKPSVPELKKKENLVQPSTNDFGTTFGELKGLLSDLEFIIDNEPTFKKYKPVHAEPGMAYLLKPKCEISKLKVQGLKTTIDRALQNITIFEEDAICDYHANLISNTCAQLFKMIQCGMSHLTNAYYKSVTTNALSLRELQGLQNTFEQLKEEHRTQINDLRWSIIMEYQAKLEIVQRGFDKVNLQLIEQTKRFGKSILELCVFKIYNNYIEEAATLFDTEIQINDKLEDIITQTYNMLLKGDTDNKAKYMNYFKIRNFLTALKSSDQRELGFETLRKVHQKNDNQESSPFAGYTTLTKICGNQKLS